MFRSEDGELSFVGGLGVGVLVAGHVILLLASGVTVVVLNEPLGITIIASAPVALSLLLVGYLLSTDLSTSLRIRVCRWIAVGGIALGIIGLLVTAIIETTFVEAFPLIAFLMGLGGTTGFGVGFMEARSIERALQAERDRDLLVFLNALLRHNVLNRVQAVHGYTTMLQDSIAEESIADVEKVQSNAMEIAEVVEDVRRLVEVAVGDQATHPTSLSNYIESEVDTIRSKHTEVEISTSIPGDTYVEGNAFLGYLFQPLIENAIEHNDTDDLEISISAAVDDGTVVTRVADDGAGVSTDELHRFGEPPTEGDQGVGVYMANTLARSYDGRMWAENQASGGLAVFVELPRASTPLSPDGEEAAAGM